MSTSGYEGGVRGPVSDRKRFQGNREGFHMTLRGFNKCIYENVSRIQGKKGSK